MPLLVWAFFLCHMKMKASHVRKTKKGKRRGDSQKYSKKQIHYFVMNLSMQRKHGSTHEGRATGLNTQQRLLLVKLSQWQSNFSMNFGRDRNITHNKVHYVHQVEVFFKIELGDTCNVIPACSLIFHDSWKRKQGICVKAVKSLQKETNSGICTVIWRTCSHYSWGLMNLVCRWI